MYRALLISLALHLVILITPGPLLPGEGAAAGRTASQRAVLRKAVSPAETTPIAGKELADINMPRASRKPSVLPRRLPKSLGFSPGLSSTVAISPAGQKDAQGAQGGGLATAALSGEGEREYRLNLARVARRFKGDPSVARTRPQEGKVLIAISMAQDARWPEIFLQRSSGFDELDRQAVGMMEQAVKVAPIPPVLQGRGFQIVVPVEYRWAD